MAAPTSTTEWASDAAALKIQQTLNQRSYGWSTSDNTVNGVPVKPNLQNQNWWQNSVHDWITYLNDNIGAGGGGGKNYVLNPDGATDTANITGVSAGGTITVTRTTDVDEKPEKSKATAILISSDASVAADDYVEWEIETTLIDPADGGRFGTLECRILEIAGSDINGAFKLQAYDFTNSVYIGDSDTITGTGYYYVDVPLGSGLDIRARLVSLVTDPDDMSASGMTISPVSAQTATFTTEPELYTPSDVTGWTADGLPTTGTWDQLEYAINSKKCDIGGDFIAGTVSGSVCRVSLPNNWTVDFKGATDPVMVGWLQVGQVAVGKWIPVLATHGDTWLEFGRVSDGSSANPLTSSTGTNFGTSSLRHTFFASVPVAELSAGSIPTVSGVLYENATAFMTYDAANALSAGLNNMQIDNASGVNGFTFASGTSNQLTPLFTGRIQLSAGFAIVNHRRELRLQVDDGTVDKKILQFSGQVSGDTAAETNRMSGACAFEVTAGVALTFKSYVTSATTTSGNPGEDLFIDVVRIPDYSARKAGLPLSDSATTSKEYLLPDIRSTGDGDAGEGDLGAITNWAGFSGAKKYRWYVIGKICFFEMRCDSGVASTSSVALVVTLPSDVPTPSEFSNTGNNEFALVTKSWRALGAGDGPVAGRSNDGAIYRQDPDWRIYGYTTSAEASKLWLWSAFWRID